MNGITSLSLLDLKFISLLALIGCLRVFCPARYNWHFGLCATVAVIGWAAPMTLLVIGGITICYLYPLQCLMRVSEAKQWPAEIRRSLLPCGIVGLVLLLVIFKLERHFTLPWIGEPKLQSKIVALIGFSYFIFRAISFLHIQSLLKFSDTSPLPLLFYALFPSTITSGPIQKYQDFRQQLASPVSLTFGTLGEAGYRITRGYFRKVVVAVLLNEAAGKMLAITRPTVWVSIITITLFYLFFYYDFAGYSDVAIGFGLLLGIRVPENFRKPFQATTVAEFWRNWHITLADWFRDQMFIPLGGMRAGRVRASIIAASIMILCGLWHGITLSFLAWGLWHGLILATEALSGTKPVAPARRVGVGYWLRVLWTNARVAFGAVFFLPYDSIRHLLGGFANFGQL